MQIFKGGFPFTVHGAQNTCKCLHSVASVCACLCVHVHVCDSLGHGGEGQLHIQPRSSAGLHEGHSKLLHTETSLLLYSQLVSGLRTLNAAA